MSKEDVIQELTDINSSFAFLSPAYLFAIRGRRIKTIFLKPFWGRGCKLRQQYTVNAKLIDLSEKFSEFVSSTIH